MAIYKLPYRFWADHEERDLPAGTLVKRTGSRGPYGQGGYAHVEMTDEERDEVLNDAEHYAHPSGPDCCPPGLISSAKATVLALQVAIAAQAAAQAAIVADPPPPTTPGDDRARMTIASASGKSYLVTEGAPMSYSVTESPNHAAMRAAEEVIAKARKTPPPTAADQLDAAGYPTLAAAVDLVADRGYLVRVYGSAIHSKAKPGDDLFSLTIALEVDGGNGPGVIVETHSRYGVAVNWSACGSVPLADAEDFMAALDEARVIAHFMRKALAVPR